MFSDLKLPPPLPPLPPPPVFKVNKGKSNCFSWVSLIDRDLKKKKKRKNAIELLGNFCLNSFTHTLVYLKSVSWQKIE